MKTILLDAIIVRDRQRKEIKQPDIDALKRSIVSKGLLHPIVLTEANELVAGGRRLTAMIQLYEESLTFRCDGVDIAAGYIPFINVSDLTIADLEEAELEENILRVPLAMFEEVAAKAKIHQLRCEQNPKQTVIDTAREIVEVTGGALYTERQALAESLIIMQHKDDPRVKRAKTRKEAYNAILDQQEVKWQAALARQESGRDQSHTIIHGDCLVELPKLPAGSVASIISDPPYGISADKQGKESNHYYDDSPQNALTICETIIREGFRIVKTRGILFLFCAQEHYPYLKNYAAQQAWTVWPTPLIWFKGSSGHAPWGRAGFRKTHEIILFAVKGQAELKYFGGDDVLQYDRVGRGERVHAAEKPYELLHQLVRLSTLPGETILDPCGGSGAIIPAARARSCRTVVIERDETSYSECLARLSAAIPEDVEETKLETTKTDFEALLREAD